MTAQILRLQTPTRGRKVALVTGLALVVLSVAMVWTYWEEIRFFLKFERLGKNEQRYPEYRHRDTGIVFVMLPGGSFEMGSPENEAGREKHEGPVHTVTLTPFLIAKYEVSQAEWTKVMGINPSGFKGGTLPVEQISWADCQEFCAKSGLSLPTEAQWEYACRGGTRSAYWSGDSEEDLARVSWYEANSGLETHPVGEKLPNDFGLHDMHGNVWEWCKDVYDPKFYSKTEANESDPVSTSGSARHVLRGGAWHAAAWRCRAAFRRFKNSPDRHIGFRPAWSPP